MCGSGRRRGLLGQIRNAVYRQYQRLIDSWLDSDLGIERYFTYIVTKNVKSVAALQSLRQEGDIEV